MRIAIVTTSFPLQPDASSGIFVWRLAAALPDELEKTVITPCPDFPVQADLHNGISVQCFRYAPRRWQRLAHGPGGIPVALRRHRWMILLLPVLLGAMLLSCFRVARRVDVLHANWSINGLVAGMAGRLTGTPVITTLRGSDVSRLSASRLQRLLLAGCLRTSCRVVTVNDAIRNRICSLYPRYSSRVVTVPNGVDSELLSIARLPVTDRPLRITSIGNLNPNKGMHLILAALALVKSPGAIRLQIVGDGPERNRLQSMADKLSAARATVQLTGAVAPDRIPALLADTDIFILASYAEGRPNVVLEAMAAGLPVLGSDIDGIRELVTHGDTGLLFRVDDPGALAGQLERLLQDPALRERLGQAARRFIISSRLSWERCAGSYHELYNSCLQPAATA